MADTRKLDHGQFNELKEILNNMTKQITKWQGVQDQTLKEGLSAIALAISGEEKEKIQALTDKLKRSNDDLQAAEERVAPEL